MGDVRDFIVEGAKWLRDQDSKYAKSLRISKWISVWDVDEARLKGEGASISVIQYGVEVLVTSVEPIPKMKDKVVMDIGDYMMFQFVSERDFKKLLPVYKIFQCKFSHIADREYEGLNNYCRLMDEKILAMFWRLRANKVDDVLNRLWLQMGGGTIVSEDRRGRRIGYLAKLIEKYKRDGDETILRRLGFIR